MVNIILNKQSIKQGASSMNKQISNLQFIATLLHIKPNQLTYTEVMAIFQHWRGQPLNVQRYSGEITKNTWGTQYLSYAPDHGGRYKRIIWDSTNKHYHLLPSGNKYIVNVASVEELMECSFKG